MKIFSNEKGQALLIIVLVMVVALTVTLSIVSRSVTNLKTSVDQTSSQKALVAAEAGIEQAIRASDSASVASGNPIALGNNTNYQAKITQLVDASADPSQTSFLVYGGNLIAKDEGGYIWLSKYDINNTWATAWPSTNPATKADITIYWGAVSDVCDPVLSKNTMAALELVLISGTPAAPVINRYAVDPCLARRGANKFTAEAAGTVVSGKAFSYSYKLSNVSQGLLLRVIPLYSSSYMAAKLVNNNPSPNSVPPQGQVISSIGSSGSPVTLNPTIRKISVYQGFPQLPAEFFPYSLLSP